LEQNNCPHFACFSGLKCPIFPYFAQPAPMKELAEKWLKPLKNKKTDRGFEPPTC
jgi:hypothetical protein